MCMPLKAAKMCTMSRARKTILILMALSIIYNIPRMLEFHTVERIDPLTNQTVASYELTTIGGNTTFRHIYFIYLHIIVMLTVPFGLLAVLNTLLIRAVKRSEKTTGKVNQKTKKENSLTIMLISVIFVFMICQLPSIVDNVFVATLSQETLYQPIFVKITCVSNLMVILNSAVNFYIYCLFGKKFRRVFCRIFCLNSLCNLTGSQFMFENNTSLMQGSMYNGTQRTRDRNGAQRTDSRATLRSNNSGATLRSKNGSVSYGSSSGFNNNRGSKVSMSVFENGRCRSYYGSRDSSSGYGPVQYERVETQATCEQTSV